eukprot:14793860-Alexandrium_andersonii.AAC.1
MDQIRVMTRQTTAAHACRAAKAHCARAGVLRASRGMRASAVLFLAGREARCRTTWLGAAGAGQVGRCT